jgi:hypothetical protein
MDQHVAVGIQHEHIRLSLAPAAAGDTEVAESRFPFGLHQVTCIFHERDERARVLMLIDLIGLVVRVCAGTVGARGTSRKGIRARGRVQGGK